MSLQEAIERIRNRPEPASSRAVEHRIVIPILRELGWDDSDDTQVDVGYLLGGRSNDEIDFALRGSADTGLVLLQLLPLGSQSKMEALRIINGAVADHFALAILSNGAEWWFYLPPAQPGPPEQQCFAQINLFSDPVDRCVEIVETFLTRASLENGDAIAAASKTLAMVRARGEVIAQLPSVWKRMLSEPDSMLVELLQEEISRAVNAEASEADVVTFLREQARNGGPVVPRPPLKTPVASKRAKRRRKPPNRPVAFTLWRTRRPVTHWADVWSTVAEMLLERYRSEFDRAVGKPGGRRSYIDRDTSNHLNGQRLANSQYFIDRHGSGVELERRSRQLLRIFGHSPDELELEFPES